MTLVIIAVVFTGTVLGRGVARILQCGTHSSRLTINPQRGYHGDTHRIE